MGCWNATCTLTGLPILYGDEVYVIPLVDNTGHSPCYTTSHYKPISLPFEGVYDDYGRAESCHGPFLDKTIEDLRNIIVLTTATGMCIIHKEFGENILLIFNLYY